MFGEKLLTTTGGATTVTVAVAVLPIPPLVELTVTLLFFTPAIVPFTLTEMTHELLVVSVPFVRLIVFDPAVAVTVPPQAPLTLGGVATTSPPGSVSVKLIPVSVGPVFGLLMVKVRVLVLPSAMVVGSNVLPITGGASTATVLVQVLLQPLLLFVTVDVKV